MIRAAGLTKRFGSRAAVDGISFEIQRGQIAGFLGPNGAGKTTTMRLLAGYLPPDAGRAEILGLDAAESPLEARARLGYLPENNPLYADLEVVDSLRFCARLRGMEAERTERRLREVLKACGLRSEAGKRIAELSKGFRQRLGLAQAILHEPDVLILDEPTSGLDPNQVEEVRQLIRELGRDKTVLLSTHILPEVAALCDRILIVNAGRLVADGTPAQLQGEGERRFAVRLKGPASEIEAALKRVPGVREVRAAVVEDAPGFELAGAEDADPREDVFRLAASRGWPLLTLREERQSLDDVFRRLTRLP
jgi:ABC-2 type transport system ATP-binding protein